MGWDMNIDLSDYVPGGSAIVPDDDYVVEITDAQPGEKENVGGKVTFSLKIIEGEYAGQTLRVAPYVPGKDFKGTDGQANWAKRVWHDLVLSSGLSPEKVKGKDAVRLAKSLVGRKVIATTEQSKAKLTPAEVAAGAEPRTFCNIRTFRVYHPGKVTTLPTAEEESAAPEASVDDDGDEFDLDALA